MLVMLTNGEMHREGTGSCSEKTLNVHFQSLANLRRHKILLFVVPPWRWEITVNSSQYIDGRNNVNNKTLAYD